MSLITNKIQTYTGRFIDPINPDQSKISIIDIAHSLSNMCRYAGHCKRFYSVAQHSVIVSEHVPSEDAMWGLLHDSCEAYITDMPRPVKHNSTGVFEFFKEAEQRLQTAIAAHFGLYPNEEPPSVKLADRRACAAEIRDLMTFGKSMNDDEQDPLKETIVPVDPLTANKMFIERYIELGGKVE